MTKKICHIASVDITVKFLLMPQLKALLNEGYEVSVVCSNGKLVEEIRKEGINVKVIEITRRYFSPLSDILAFFKLWFYFEKEKFDIVHTHAPKPALLGQLAAKMAGVPVIINTIHGLYFTENSSYFRRKLFILIEKISAKCSTFIFSQNKEDIETMIKEKIALPEKIKYLGNGIDLEKFDIKKYSEDFILKKKKELGIDTNKKIIGTVGRLVAEKGYMELFESMKTVLEKFPDALLLVIGPEEHDKKDKFNPSIVKNYGIEKNVKFLGERKDIDELYSIMDIFVLASHREGFPRSVIEAMAMERPIIVTNIRGCREEIDNSENGMVIPVKNSEKLSEAILFLLDNKEKSKEYAKNARAKALREFNEDIVISKIKEEYSRLTKKNIKICHVATVDITIKFILWDILKFLRKEDYDVSIVCSEGKWVQTFRDDGFKVHNINMTRSITPFKDLKSLIKLFFYFRKEKFDIVHTCTPKAGIIGRIAARLAGVPIVIHSSHGFYIGVKMEESVRRIIMFAEKVASYFCDIIISQNQEDVDFVIKEKIINPKKIKLLRYGIDINRFNPSNFSQEFILSEKNKLGLVDKKVIGMVGRFVKEKGYLDLFNAFKIVKNKIPNAVLLLVAPKDKKYDALDKEVFNEYGIDKDVILLGHEKEITNIEQIYPLMDVFILPSYREGFPYSIMESSASAKPVIATDIRGCREAVENNVTGKLFPIGDYNKLAEELIYFLNNEDKAKEMGNMGRKKAEKEFDQNIAFQKIKEEYESLINKKIK